MGGYNISAVKVMPCKCIYYVHGHRKQGGLNPEVGGYTYAMACAPLLKLTKRVAFN